MSIFIKSKNSQDDKVKLNSSTNLDINHTETSAAQEIKVLAGGKVKLNSSINLDINHTETSTAQEIKVLVGGKAKKDLAKQESVILKVATVGVVEVAAAPAVEMLANVTLENSTAPAVEMLANVTLENSTAPAVEMLANVTLENSTAPAVEMLANVTLENSTAPAVEMLANVTLENSTAPAVEMLANVTLENSTAPEVKMLANVTLENSTAPAVEMLANVTLENSIAPEVENQDLAQQILAVLRGSIEAGQSIDMIGDQNTVELAILLDLVVVLEFLHEAGVEIKSIDDTTTPLHTAVESAAEGCVKYLSKIYPAVVNSQDYAGNTPLHVAATYGYKDILTYLIQEMKADTNILNNENNSALDLIKEHISAYQDLDLSVEDNWQQLGKHLELQTLITKNNLSQESTNIEFIGSVVEAHAQQKAYFDYNKQQADNKHSSAVTFLEKESADFDAATEALQSAQEQVNKSTADFAQFKKDSKKDKLEIISAKDKVKPFSDLIASLTQQIIIEEKKLTKANLPATTKKILKNNLKGSILKLAAIKNLQEEENAKEVATKEEQEFQIATKNSKDLEATVSKIQEQIEAKDLALENLCQDNPKLSVADDEQKSCQESAKGLEESFSQAILSAFKRVSLDNDSADNSTASDSLTFNNITQEHNDNDIDFAGDTSSRNIEG